MRYFAKFHDGTQTKNKAQVQAYAFMKTFASILLTSDAALEKMVADMKDGIEGINAAYPRCGDIDFRAYLNEDYRGKSVNVGEICSYSFYAVVSSFSVIDITNNENTNTENSSKTFEL
jgi:hypothetical protein